MAIGYVLLAQELTINGNASIDSTWKVEITNITQKEINGYKIRLITLEELQQNFGWTELNAYATSGDNSSVPTWVYRDFTVDKIAYGYWTMTPKPSPSNNVWFMSTSEQLNVYYGHDYGNTGVRPVINLLKSAIE